IELPLGVRHGHRMTDDHDDGNRWERLVEPAQIEVGEYVLDEPAGRDGPMVQLVDPRIANLTGEHSSNRLEKLRPPIPGAEVLVQLEVADRLDIVGVQRLEQVAIAVIVVEQVCEPGGSAPPNAGDKHGAIRGGERVDDQLGRHEPREIAGLAQGVDQSTRKQSRNLSSDAHRRRGDPTPRAETANEEGGRRMPPLPSPMFPALVRDILPPAFNWMSSSSNYDSPG